MRISTKSQQLFEKAKRYIPGGVNSPVRAYNAVGGIPPFIAKGHGSKIYDVDGNEYTDYVCSWGPLIHGHAHPQITEALVHAIEKGSSFGAPTELELTLAEMISQAMPSIEMMRFVNSGTEAVMSAIRLARAFTGKEKILKFDGCYHGHSDGLLSISGSGIATLGIPGSPGVPSGYVQNTLNAQFNNINDVEQAFYDYKNQIAAIIVEPVAANMGVVCPQAGFLEHLRTISSNNNALLIFDEVITGFRLSYGGAQSIYGVTPDLTCLGKIIGGGLPVGAYGGRRDIMKLVAPQGSVYQAGTLSGNPLAMTAGITTLQLLNNNGAYERLEQMAFNLEKAVLSSAKKYGIHLQVSRDASLFTLFFSRTPVTDYVTARESDTKLFASFFNLLLDRGIYWPPSQFEAAFISLAHSAEDIEYTISTLDNALASISL